MYCKTCKDRKICKRICDSLEKEVLSKLDHSLKSNYIVKFFDPSIMEEITEDCYAELPEILKNNDDDEVYEELFNEQKELNKRLYLCIDKLNYKRKRCVVLYYGLEDNILHTQQEIATSLKISQENVKYNLRVAREQIACLFYSII